MRKSETVGKVMEALGKAQAQFPVITMNKEVDYLSKREGKRIHYKWADLSSILSAVRKPLTENGLAVTQTIEYDGTNAFLETVLGHASGEWFSSTYRLNLGGAAQEKGSEITYARRYNIAAILGIAAEEDEDGAAADDRDRETKKPSKQVATRQAPAPGKPTAKNSQPPAPPASKSVPEKSKASKDGSREQLNRVLMNLYRPFVARYPETRFVDLLQERYNVPETKLMTINQIEDLVTFMKKMTADEPQQEGEFGAYQGGHISDAGENG